MNKGIIYFSAPWCEPCKILGPIIDQIGKEYGIPLKKVNTQYNASDTEHYNVKSVPTLIISDRDGNEIKRIQGGGMSKEDVLNWFNN
jgi:thiol-disulfide isomerase/thioredoxin|tara:strand:+ start:266 stop:526 length:261 start_codon:yes stop_codon:yes gene_type:complete